MHCAKTVLQITLFSVQNSIYFSQSGALAECKGSVQQFWLNADSIKNTVELFNPLTAGVAYSRVFIFY